MKIEAETFIKVQFYDVDSMSVVWHGNYIKYLETARCNLLSKIGYDYNNMREDGVAYPVATMEVKFIKPCTFNQNLRVVALLEEIEPCMLIKYQIFDADTGDKVFKAKSMQICVNVHTKESEYSAPERLKEKLACCNL